MEDNVISLRVQLKCLFPKEESCPSPDSFSLEEMKGSAFAENCCCPQVSVQDFVNILIAVPRYFLKVFVNIL